MQNSTINLATSYQIIAEIRHPVNQELLYVVNMPEVFNYSLKRELLTDNFYFEEWVMDLKKEHLAELTVDGIHPSDRHWYNATGFIPKRLNEIIHIDCLDSTNEDMSSYVNCHILIISNKTDETIYEFGTPHTPEEKINDKKKWWQKAIWWRE